MKKEIADKWVEALRSGKYKQTKKVLSETTNDGAFHCCLGVLCELALEEIDLEIKFLSGTGIKKYDNSVDVLPTSVMVWSGIRTYYAYIDTYEESLVSMNDSGKTFYEIADYIDKNWRKL